MAASADFFFAAPHHPNVSSNAPDTDADALQSQASAIARGNAL